MSKQLSGQCPCCQAPLPPPQDEFKITCTYCGAQIILKLPIDKRIEKIAFERYVYILPTLGQNIPMMPALIFFYGWPIWRFWLRDSGYLENPLIFWGLMVLIVLFCVGYPILLSRARNEMERCANDCGWSLNRLRTMVKNQPTKASKTLLREVEKNIEKIKRQLEV